VPAKAGTQRLARRPGVGRDPAHLPSFPRKRESICFCSLWFGRFARTGSRPCAFSSAILAAELLSFACAKESNQRKHTLASAVVGHPARRLREQAPGSDCGTSCAVIGPARIPARARVRCTRLFPPPARRGQEGPGRAKRGSPCRRRKSKKK